MGVTNNYNFPYPEPSEPVRNGAANIRALAEAIANRLFTIIAGNRVDARRVVATFGSNGEAIVPYSFAFSAVPACSATASNSDASADAGVVLTFYQPQFWQQQFTVLARYAKDGRIFTGNLDMYYVAVGPV